MRKILALSILSTLGLALASRGLRAEEPRAIIAKAIQAQGGEKLLRQAHASLLTLKGIYVEQNKSPFTATLHVQQPNQYKISLRMVLLDQEPFVYTQTVNGDQFWIQKNDVTEDIDKASLADMKTQAYLEYIVTLLPLLSEKSFTLAALPEIKVQDQPAVGVRVTAPDKPEVKLYFDPTSGFLVKIAYLRADPDSKKEALREEYHSDFRDQDLGAADEKALKAARQATDGPALVEYLRRRTLEDDKREKIEALIRKLGDNNFEVREKAKEQLAAQGEVTVPLLAQATTNADPEIAARAKECLQTLKQTADPTQPAAVVRRLALLKPAGAAEALLGYLPNAPDPQVIQEIQVALAALAYADGTPDKALGNALQAKDPRRREAAKAALGTDAKAARESPGQRVYLPGFKQYTKGSVYQDGVKEMEWQVTQVQFFNKFDESVFARP